MSDTVWDDENERPLDEADVENWEAVSPGARKPLSAVLTVRFSEEELKRVRDVAKASGESMGDVVRQAVQGMLQVPVAQIRTMGWTTTESSSVNILARSGIVTFGDGTQVLVARSA